MEHAAYQAVEDQLKAGPTNVLGPCLCSAECLGVTALGDNAELISDGEFLHGQLEQFPHFTPTTSILKYNKLVVVNVCTYIMPSIMDEMVLEFMTM